MPSKRARTASRSTVKNVPFTLPWSALTMSRRSTCSSWPSTTIVFSRNAGDSNSTRAPALATITSASAARALAAALARRGLSHTIGPFLEPRRFENLQAEILEGQPGVARGHGYERMVGHARRGVDLEEIRLSREIEHQIHAAPTAAP